MAVDMGACCVIVHVGACYMVVGACCFIYFWCGALLVVRAIQGVGACFIVGVGASYVVGVGSLCGFWCGGFFGCWWRLFVWLLVRWLVVV